MQYSITVPTPEQTEALKRTFFDLYPGHKVFCFQGELGAGKTTFIKSLCRDLGVHDEMSSPSFSIVNEYVSDTEGSIYHFDLYRIKDKGELAEIGWFDYLSSGNLMFIEWPEMAEDLLPEDAVMVYITPADNGNARNLTISYQP